MEERERELGLIDSLPSAAITDGGKGPGARKVFMVFKVFPISTGGGTRSTLVSQLVPAKDSLAALEQYRI